MDFADFTWLREPRAHSVADGVLTVVTEPHTDLWQRTYYGFCNDNAPLLLATVPDRFFSFTVRTEFSGAAARFDQCGVAVYQDGRNWLKASVEHEDGVIARLGSVVTNHGWSDWATTDIPGSVTALWYRLSRRGADFCVESSRDGLTFQQMRICHLAAAEGPVRLGLYACSPEDSSFAARFSHLTLGPCQWAAHDGQPPDEDVRLV